MTSVERTSQLALHNRMFGRFRWISRLAACRMIIVKPYIKLLELGFIALTKQVHL